MKRSMFLTVCLSALALTLGAQENRNRAKDLLLPVDFSITLGDLHRAAQRGDDRSIPGGKLLVLNADIGSVTLRSDTDTQFAAEVELIGGAWHGEDSVELYRAYALFEGGEFRAFFSKTSSQRVQTGQHVLILARYLGLGLDYDETTPIAVVEALGLRLTN